MTKTEYEKHIDEVFDLYENDYEQQYGHEDAADYSDDDEHLAGQILSGNRNRQERANGMVEDMKSDSDWEEVDEPTNRQMIRTLMPSSEQL